jgi:hypothetical protein
LARFAVLSAFFAALRAFLATDIGEDAPIAGSASISVATTAIAAIAYFVGALIEALSAFQRRR